MKKILISSLLMLGLTLHLHAFEQNVKPLADKMIQKLDRQMTKHQAKKRHFRTLKEFRHLRQRNHTKPNIAHIASKRVQRLSERYANGRGYADPSMRNRHHSQYIRQHGYVHPKRAWVLAYRYDRASFYDNEGFFYGYFNRFGYYFENEFYRYDRYYTYRDRIRGHGLFDNQYYMPANARYYGLCNMHDNRAQLYKQDGYSRY